MNNTMFSIIVPVYNTDIDLLDICIHSILKQSYKNYEIILVNDCSTNKKTISYIKKLKNKKIRKINNEINIGLGPTRNVGIKHSLGDVILFVDSDDWISSDMLEELSKIDYDSVDLVSFNFFKVLDNNLIIRNDDYINSIDDLNIYGGGTSWSKAYSRKFICDNNLLFHNSKLYHEDEYFTMLCLRYNPSIYTLDMCFYYYRMCVPNSITNSESVDRRFNDFSILINDLNLSKKDSILLRNWYSKFLSTTIFWYLEYDKASFRKFIKYSKAWRKNRMVVTSIKKNRLLYMLSLTYISLLMLYVFRKRIFKIK